MQLWEIVVLEVFTTIRNFAALSVPNFRVMLRTSNKTYPHPTTFFSVHALLREDIWKQTCESQYLHIEHFFCRWEYSAFHNYQPPTWTDRGGCTRSVRRCQGGDEQFVGITSQNVCKSLISLIWHALQIQGRVFLRSPKRRRHAPHRENHLKHQKNAYTHIKNAYKHIQRI